MVLNIILRRSEEVLKCQRNPGARCWFHRSMLTAGQVLRNRYRIVRPLSQGGMGAVFEGLDQNLADSPCAVKVLLPGSESEEGAYLKARFFEEMKVLSRLQHACIPRVRDFFCEGSQLVLVMEFIQGPSLASEGLRAVPEVVADIISVLDTVEYLHGHSPPLLHRDLKPANLVRDARSGRVYLVDFGLARSSSDLAQTQVGTLGYCAPEQMVGQATPQSDLYSLGVTLHTLLTGLPPDIDFFRQRTLERVEPALARILAKATQLKASDRYASASEMAAELRSWLSPQPEVESPKRAPSNLLPLVASTMIMLVASLSWASLTAKPPAPSAPPSVPRPALPDRPVATPQAVLAPPAPVPVAGREPLPVAPPVRRAPPPQPKSPQVVIPRLDSEPDYPTYQGKSEPEPEEFEPVALSRRPRLDAWRQRRLSGRPR